MAEKPQDSPEEPILPIRYLAPEVPVPLEAKEIEPGLEMVWDKEIDAEFRGLPTTYVKFVNEWVKGGMIKPYEAYQRGVDRSATKEIAQAAARVMMRHKGVKMFMERLKDVAMEDFFDVRRTLVEALDAKDEVWVRDPVGNNIKLGDAPNHSARIRAAEVLAKLHGLNAPEKHEVKSEHRSIVLEVQLPPIKEQ